jgi:hypothetical protein
MFRRESQRYDAASAKAARDGGHLNVSITCSGSDRSEDLRSLMEWLPKANPALRLRAEGPPVADDGHLGISLDEISSLTGAAVSILELSRVVHGWVLNRYGRKAAGDAPEIPADHTGPVTVGPVTIIVLAGAGSTQDSDGPDPASASDVG